MHVKLNDISHQAFVVDTQRQCYYETLTKHLPATALTACSAYNFRGSTRDALGGWVAAPVENCAMRLRRLFVQVSGDAGAGPGEHSE